MRGTSAVLCKYYLHGACKFGSSCAFSHSMEDAESQVCKYYLKGECAYGDRCRYLHTKPEWATARREGTGASASSAYVAPVVPRPAADDLASQLPISRLRLGGQAPDARPCAAGGSSGSINLPLPVRLPRDPFGSTGEVNSVGGTAPSGNGGEGQQADALPAADDEQQYYEEGDEWHGYYEGEGYWDEEGEEEQGQWCDEGGGEDWQQYYRHDQEQGDEGDWLPEEAGGQQPPAASSNSGNSTQPRLHAWSLPAEADEGRQQQWAAASHPSLRSLCMQWFSSGACSRGERCHVVHGQLCQHCHKYALHPTDSAAREQHLAECQLRHERLAARARSAAVECGICLEPVLSKAAPGDRKFGLLTGCDHPFCLRCIRSWRQKTDGGADVDTALRTCPVCRTVSYYIVPSLVWPTNEEEKERIVAGYRAKLSQIDCRHFNFGDSSCPFGTSCFYRHAYPDGRLEDKTLRKAADEEGNVCIMQPVRLSDFIQLSAAGRRLGRRR